MKALFVAYIFCIYFPQASDLSQVDEWVTGVAKAPYDPKYNNTAIMTADGNLYSATVTDFKGRDPAICRIMGTICSFAICAVQQQMAAWYVFPV